MLFALLYKPPCGEWYVHSHKLYSSREEAVSKAAKFLPVGTSISILPIAPDEIDSVETRVFPR